MSRNIIPLPRHDPSEGESGSHQSTQGKCGRSDARLLRTAYEGAWYDFGKTIHHRTESGVDHQVFTSHEPLAPEVHGKFAPPITESGWQKRICFPTISQTTIQRYGSDDRRV